MIGDGEWAQAATTASFIQYEPRRGDSSESQTEALVLYDAGHLYVAFRAWDAEPINLTRTASECDSD